MKSIEPKLSAGIDYEIFGPNRFGPQLPTLLPPFFVTSRDEIGVR
jgi:hypothetical protein